MKLLILSVIMLISLNFSSVLSIKISKCCEPSFILDKEGGCIAAKGEFLDETDVLTPKNFRLWPIIKNKENITIAYEEGNVFGCRDPKAKIKIMEKVRMETFVGQFEQNVTVFLNLEGEKAYIHPITEVCVDRLIGEVEGKKFEDSNDSNNETLLFVKLCILPSIEGHYTRRCCPQNRINATDLSCKNVNGKNFEDSIFREVKMYPKAAIFVGEPMCTTGTYEISQLQPPGFTAFEIEPSTGALIIGSEFGTQIIKPEHYCAHDTIDGDKFAQVCFEEYESEENLEGLSRADGSIVPVLPDEMATSLDMWRTSLYPFLTGVSSFFLVVTVIIYLILWSELSLPGWLQFSYALALLFSFASLTIVQVWTQELRKLSVNLCRIIGYVLLCSFLSCFFWLTTMNIDLWLNFRTTVMMQTKLSKSRGRKRYFIAFLFSVGIPIVITLLAVFTDIQLRKPAEKFTPNVVTRLGYESCTLSLHNKMAQLYYFYSCVGVLLMVNVGFFCCTVMCLRERQKETEIAHNQSTAAKAKREADRERFQLFTRLFFIMGVLWIFELVSWITELLHVGENVKQLFVFTDCLNALQGAFIFVLFVWKRRTGTQLRKKCALEKFRRRSQSTLRSTSVS